MGLKHFHILFIIFSIALAGFFSKWAQHMHGMTEGQGYFVTACVSGLSAIGLVVYAIVFIKKAKAL